MDCFENGEQVFCLVDAGEIEGIELYVVGYGAGGDFGDEMMALIGPILDIPLFIRKFYRCLFFMGALFEDGRRFRICFADDHGDAGFDDAGFFEGDPGEGVA